MQGRWLRPACLHHRAAPVGKDKGRTLFDTPSLARGRWLAQAAAPQRKKIIATPHGSHALMAASPRAHNESEPQTASFLCRSVIADIRKLLDCCSRPQNTPVSMRLGVIRRVVPATACLLTLDKVWGQGQSTNKLHRGLWLSGSMKPSSWRVLTSEVYMRL